MKNLAPLFSLTALLLVGCTRNSQSTSKPEQPSSASSAATLSIGGEPIVNLIRRTKAEGEEPHFVQATILPGRGMNMLQLRAYVPGKGEIDLLNSMPPLEAKKFLDTADDTNGTNGFRIGAAILLPWVNRIRGKLTADGKSLEVPIDGKTYLLPADWAGKREGAEKHAIHGFILNARFDDIFEENGPAASRVVGVLRAGDFNGRWPSQTEVKTSYQLTDTALEIQVTATNVGKEVLPMGIAFHPYFNLPSGHRQQAMLHLPSQSRAVVNNYDDVFPTGKIVPVKGTPYDFSTFDGRALGDLYMDDNFPNVEHAADGSSVVQIVDPEAHYGLRMTSLSPEVSAYQVYAPPDKAFIVAEPQFNWNDPFSKIWGKRDTHMVRLQPGQSVSWKVRLELFVPNSKSNQ